MVLSEFFFYIYFIFFFFFRLQGFRMITFDRQAGPLQNFNRSHVMVIGSSVAFSDPAQPQNPPSQTNLCAFQNPRNIFEKKHFSPPPSPNFLFVWAF